VKDFFRRLTVYMVAPCHQPLVAFKRCTVSYS
jgi:hypothetical protein